MDKTKIFAAVEKFAQKGQTDKALENLELILRSDPSDLKALNRAADLYLKESQFEKAVENLKRIGEVYSRDGFYSKAVAIYKRILKIDKIGAKSTVIKIHEQLASLYGQLGLISDAMGHYSIVVDFYDQAGDRAALLVALKAVCELDPNNVESRLKMVELLLGEKREEEATASLAGLVEFVQARKNTVDLIRVLERSLELFPKDVERLQILVDVYLKANEPKKALAKIQAAFRVDPRNALVLEMLSVTFLALKQPDKARAVDVELVKLYRQHSDLEKVAQVEARIQGSPMKAAAPAAKAEPQPADEPVDPIESLVRALPLSPEEKKIISECEVYFKYGLAEKAYEVLKTRLAQFPQSLILRWKLKSATQDLKKNDETAHLLSEIILLAKSQNLGLWANLAASELQALDPAHPALSGMEKKPAAQAQKATKQPVEAPTAKVAPAAKAPAARAPASEEFSFKDFEGSDVSIVIDEEFSDDSSSVGDISLNDGDDERTRKQESLVEEPLELMEDSSAVEVSAPPPPPPPAAGADVEPSESIEVIEMADGEPENSAENILSDADFTDDELKSLGKQLEGEPERKSVSSAKTAAERLSEAAESVQIEVPAEAEMEPVFEIEPDAEPVVEPEPKLSPEPLVEVAAIDPNAISAPMDLGGFSEEKSEVLGDAEFEIRQGLEEISFFRTQGLNDEADSLLAGLKKKHPEHAAWAKLEADVLDRGQSKKVNDEKLNKKTLDVETLGRKVRLSVQEDTRLDSDADFVDLAGELNDELAVTKNEPSIEVKEVFNAFKKGVSATVSADDFATHFDLGVAYREMGLFEDAIEEFKLVSTAPNQKISAYYQIGLTRAAMGEYAEAKDAFDRALREPGLGDQEKMSLSYELGEVLLKLNNKDKAKKLFEEVKKIDPEFREVQSRIKAIG